MSDTARATTDSAARIASPDTSLIRDTLASDTLASDTSRAPRSARRAPQKEYTTRFYARRRYGSESQFNPLSLVVNGGFDQLRTRPTRPIFTFPYGPGFHSLWYSVLHYDAVVRHFGVKNWLVDEVFPLSLKGSGGGQWYPNYQLHLLGGGATYAEMVEWYEQHGVSHPELASGFTMYAWHLLTETVEHLGYCCENEDSLTDLTIFDFASIVLFNQDWAKRQFGRALEFKTWQGQPAMIGNSLENAYMMAMIRTQLPFTTNWRAINTFGNAFLFGPSRRFGRDTWFSATAGFDPVDNPVIDAATNKQTADLKANYGLFIDRQGSLLVSFISKGGSTNGATLNIYPGVIGWRRVTPGFWMQKVRTGGVRYGVVSPWGLGVGWLQGGMR